jgi:hypothetical protein
LLSQNPFQNREHFVESVKRSATQRKPRRLPFDKPTGLNHYNYCSQTILSKLKINKREH